MPRNLYTPSTSPVPPAPDPLLRFIQQAQLTLVYSRRREGRLPLHDSFRLTLEARDRYLTPHIVSKRSMEGQPTAKTVYVDGTNNQQNAAERAIPGCLPEAGTAR